MPASSGKGNGQMLILGIIQGVSQNSPVGLWEEPTGFVGKKVFQKRFKGLLGQGLMSLVNGVGLGLPVFSLVC